MFGGDLTVDREGCEPKFAEVEVDSEEGVA